MFGKLRREVLGYDRDGGAGIGQQANLAPSDDATPNNEDAAAGEIEKCREVPHCHRRRLNEPWLSCRRTVGR
jgi:hypothetical protein